MINLAEYANEFIPQSVAVFHNHGDIKAFLESNGYEVIYSGINARYEYANTACGYTVSTNGFCSNYKMKEA